MSSYSRLADFLASHKGDRWEASFAEVEQVLGRALPPSAAKHAAWWANQTSAGHSQTRGWRSVGWRTTALDLQRRRVRFERERSAPAGDPMASAISADEALIERARVISGIEDRDELIRRALESFIRREAAERLIALGGSQSDAWAPERGRPW
jgi:hypothetical protein